ncbi:MAG TPA: class I SAM-dependent methyltransferase [Candidatus Limnocylindrales bacterium]|nr:class I SAM-dependent methyltransferase [Candidatus Limnocylindrales bacterium]
MTTERSPQDVRGYYDQHTADGVGAAGAGLIWFITGDHLSPALSNQDRYAFDSVRWREATRLRVLELAHRMGICAGWNVLDLGTGIGGPGRDIMAATGCTVYGVNLSRVQLTTLRTLSRQSGIAYDRVVHADMRWLPFRNNSFDAVFAVNSLYHVPGPAAVLAEIRRVLVPGGRFGIDDWFLTTATAEQTARQLRHSWSTPHDGFHIYENVERLIATAGLIIDEVVDYTAEAGGFLTEERFGATFDSQVAPTLIEVFPKLYRYAEYRPEHARQAANQLRADVLHMGMLYRSGEAVYRQIVGSRPGAR